MAEDLPDSIATITKVEVEMEVEAEVESEDIIDSKKASLVDLFSQMFIKENFDANVYLQAHMTPSTQTIPMSAICQSPEILEITSDEKTIRHALLESKGIIFTEDGIKLLLKPEQNTIILRDISSKTPSEDIMKIFLTEPAEASDGVETEIQEPCPPAQSVRSDMNDTWFVTFASEADARVALQAIKNRRFNGNIIKARLKTETLNKSYFSAKINQQGSFPKQGPGSAPNSGRSGHYNGGNERGGGNGHGSGRSHSRQGGNGMDRGHKEYFNGSGPPPEYMSPPLNSIPSMPGMYFGSYPVPPPPPYMGMGPNPMTLPNMQMISSYPIVMNTQTGQMQWAGPHPPSHPHGPGSGPMMNPNLHQLPMHIHNINNIPQNYNNNNNRSKTRSNPQTPREVASYGPGGHGGGGNSFRNNRQRGMSFTGPPQGGSPIFFHPQFLPQDGMSINYSYPATNNYGNGIFQYQSAPPRNSRNGKHQNQNQFATSMPASPQNYMQGPFQNPNQNQNHNQNNRKYGNHNNHYQNTGEERSTGSRRNSGNDNHSHRTPESETPDPSDRTDTSETSNSDPVPATRESSGAGHQGNNTSGNVSKMDSNERLNGSTKKVRLQVNTGASMGSSAFSSAENEGEGTTRSIELVGRGDDDKKSVSRAKGRNDDWKEGDRDRDRDRERHPREPRERDQRNREPREKGEGRDRDRDRGEPRERGEGREREGRERGEGREKGAGRTRERPAVPPKPVPQPDFNMDSDFPNLVEGDADGHSPATASAVASTAGYAAAAKRGVQDSDSESSPSAAIFASGSFEKNGNGTAAGMGTLPVVGGGKKATIKTSNSGETVPRPTAILPQAASGASPNAPLTGSTIRSTNSADSSSAKLHGTGGAVGDLVVPASDAHAVKQEVQSSTAETMPDAIQFGEFKTLVALDNVRSLHFGPALASPLLSRSSTPGISPIDSPKKPKNAQTATQPHTAPLSHTIPAADTTHIRGSDHAEKDATASSSSFSTAAPVPAPSGSAAGTGTSTPENLSTQGLPISPSGSTAAGSVWGAKRSFLDVVRTAK